MREYVHISKTYNKGGEMEILLKGFQEFISLLKKEKLFDVNNENILNEDQFDYDNYIKTYFETNLVTFFLTNEGEAIEVKKFNIPHKVNGSYYIGYCKVVSNNHFDNKVYPIFRLVIDENTHLLKALDFSGYKKLIGILNDIFFPHFRVIQTTEYKEEHILLDFPIKKIIDDKFYDFALLETSIYKMQKVLGRKQYERDYQIAGINSTLTNLSIRLEALMPMWGHRYLHIIDSYRYKQIYSKEDNI